MKTCRRCRTAKPIEDFCIKRDAKDGRSNFCRQCAAAESHARIIRYRGPNSIAGKGANPYGLREDRIDYAAGERRWQMAAVGVRFGGR